MKLFELVNRVQTLIDRDDLIAILDEFQVKHKKDEIAGGQCFLVAIAKSLSIQLNVKIDSSSLKKSLMYTYNSDLPNQKPVLHPENVKSIKKLPIRTAHIESRDEIESKIRGYFNEHFYYVPEDERLALNSDYQELDKFIEKLYGFKAIGNYSERPCINDIAKSIYDKLEADATKHYGAKISYELISSVDEIKSWLRKKVPVILSVRWNEPFYDAFVDLRDGTANGSYTGNGYDRAKSRGADKVMLQKIKHGIIPMPNKEYLASVSRKLEPDDITHAVLCLGYDASEDAFICKDWLSSNPSYEGFFKIEAAVFFNKALERKHLSVVEVAVAIWPDEVNDL